MHRIAHRLLPLSLAVLVAAGGCATADQNNQLAGTLIGAGTGALIGGLTGGGKGAAIGAVSGAAVGWASVALVQYHARRTSSAAEESQAYGYDPSQGPVVKVQNATVAPDRVRAGDRIDLAMDYAVLAPKNTPQVQVKEVWELWKDGKLVSGMPPKSMQREPGGWETRASINVPKNATPGTYVVRHRVETGGSYDGRETSFVLA